MLIHLIGHAVPTNIFPYFVENISRLSPFDRSKYFTEDRVKYEIESVPEAWQSISIKSVMQLTHATPSYRSKVL